MRRKKLLTMFLLPVAFFATAEDSGSFFLDVDDASHVKLTSAGKEVALTSGVNTITYKVWDSMEISPAEGYLIESFKAFNTDGDETTTGWWFNASADSYSTMFSSYSNNGYTYKVTTGEYKPEMWTVHVAINDATAVKNGEYTVGNLTVEATTGLSDISFNHEKGDKITITLTKSVSEATLTLNDVPQEPEDNAFGEPTYSFKVADGDNISLQTTMEIPEFKLTTADASSIDVYFPDEDTLYESLKIGVNSFTYNIGDIITVKAAEGFRITSAEGLRHQSYTDTYSYTFKGGESGREFIVMTEEYNPPMATLEIYLTDPTVLARVVADVVTKKFEQGMNTLKVNLEKETEAQLVYNINNKADIAVTVDGEPLAIEETWILSSTLQNLEARTYNIIISNTTGITDAVNTSTQQHDVYSVTGTIVLRNATPEAIESLAPGLYIIDGIKTLR